MRSAFLRWAARRDEREDDVDERDAESAGEGLATAAAVRVRAGPRRSDVGTRMVVDGRREVMERGRDEECRRFEDLESQISERSKLNDSCSDRSSSYSSR